MTETPLPRVLQVCVVRRADELSHGVHLSGRREQVVLACKRAHHWHVARAAIAMRACLTHSGAGKDIIWFHCVIWPCMLWSVGIPLPKAVFGHGFVTAADGQKMSKSIGNVVDPNDVLDKCPPDSFRCVLRQAGSELGKGLTCLFRRYYLTRGGIYGSDVSYSEESLMMMHNADLADTLGNLLHRAANLTLRMCDGVVPDVPAEVIIDVARLRRETEVAFQNYALQVRACLRARDRLLSGSHAHRCRLRASSPSMQ